MKKYWKDQLTLLLTGACDAKCANCAVKRRSTKSIGITELERNVFPHITPFHEIALCGGGADDSSKIQGNHRRRISKN